jgi:hypothetical protein
MTKRKRPIHPTPGPPPKHAGRMLERVLKQNKLDMRTNTAKMLKIIGDDLAADRGGWQHCTAGERILIERCAAVTLLCSSIESFVFKGNGPVTPNGELLSVLRKGYIAHFAALTRALTALGLERRQAEPQSLAEYLRERDAALSAPQASQSDAAAAVQADIPVETADTPEDGQDCP